MTTRDSHIGHTANTVCPIKSQLIQVIGHALRSQTNERQATEVAIAVDVLNRMLELGRPSYVRIA